MCSTHQQSHLKNCQTLVFWKRNLYVWSSVLLRLERGREECRNVAWSVWQLLFHAKCAFKCNKCISLHSEFGSNAYKPILQRQTANSKGWASIVTPRTSVGYTPTGSFFQHFHTINSGDFKSYYRKWLSIQAF